MRQPGVCQCAVVRKMSEAKLHISVAQRIVIKFLRNEVCKPSEICSRLKKQYGEKTLSNVSVYKWSSAFKKRRETVENEPHERKPRTSVSHEQSLRQYTQSGEQARELSGILNISEASVKTINNHLEYSKVCSRWIPRVLTDVHKNTRQVVQSF
jgi:hypothetical protein